MLYIYIYIYYVPAFQFNDQYSRIRAAKAARIRNGRRRGARCALCTGVNGHVPQYAKQLTERDEEHLEHRDSFSLD